MQGGVVGEGGRGMSKAIFVMDMPECCGDCKLGDLDPSGLYCIPADNYFDGNDSSEERAAWCPLRELPEKKNYEKLSDTNPVKSWGNGWNTCLDAIERKRRT